MVPTTSPLAASTVHCLWVRLVSGLVCMAGKLFLSLLSVSVTRATQILDVKLNAHLAAPVSMPHALVRMASRENTVKNWIVQVKLNATKLACVQP